MLWESKLPVKVDVSSTVLMLKFNSIKLSNAWLRTLATEAPRLISTVLLTTVTLGSVMIGMPSWHDAVYNGYKRG